jgi:N-carbamoylputrescine amidase
VKNGKPGRTVVVAALQSAFSDDADANVARVTSLVRDAVRRGANIILPPELFEGHYFCREQKSRNFDRAHPVDSHPAIQHFQLLASELGVVIPVSFFERAGQAYYNSVAIIDAGGAVLGVYRKSHIPDGPGYQEKFYFRPGDTGFKAWTTRFGTIGVGICWDQWFPECARAMVVLGADILFYPTAIGSEPAEPDLDTKDLWQRAMVGHAVSNVVPVIAANRTGKEGGQSFYGSSFIANHRGDKLAEFGRKEQGVITAPIDLDQVRRDRASFGFFRDRRPELYGVLLSPDGQPVVADGGPSNKVIRSKRPEPESAPRRVRR